MLFRSNCIISTEILDRDKLSVELKKVPSMDGLELASAVSTKTTYEAGDPAAALRIAVLDFGSDKTSSNFTITMPNNSATAALIRSSN